ncbi:beta-ketoacyl synthase N-terminal-like domain-containing protein [Bordetella tumulicola]|uniref:beta-ketoacyl synthase N-terminal-like domain-containing protein n=1 Tax=Bordetella tumulicola TaxID=1649133 RepID=UPI0039EEAFF7
MPRAELAITGVGIQSAIGQGRTAFAAALLEGRHRFDVMRRPGRQRPLVAGTVDVAPTRFIGAEMDDPVLPPSVPHSMARTLSLSGRAALACLNEAWEDAALDRYAPERVGLVVGGSNLQQRELVNMHDAYRGREQFLRPTYGMSFMDSDLCGVCTQVFGIRGPAFTIGGASASGQVAVIEAAQAVASGRVDVCIAIGGLMDLSYWECQGLRSLGAMGSDRYADAPALACRPFDQSSDGFVFGELCGAVVIESQASARQHQRTPYARLAGWAMIMDAHRNPDPSGPGEVAVIQSALQHAGLSPHDIDYVNPHGTGSNLGDKTEVGALRECGLEHAYLNTTKSLTGHGLSAAGTAELIAVLLQMREGQLHPARNLDQPISSSMNWVGPRAVSHSVQNALNLSMGFGGTNTAVCVQRCA